MDSKCYYCDEIGVHRMFDKNVLLCRSCHFVDLARVRKEYFQIRKYRPF